MGYIRPWSRPSYVTLDPKQSVKNWEELAKSEQMSTLNEIPKIMEKSIKREISKRFSLAGEANRDRRKA